MAAFSLKPLARSGEKTRAIAALGLICTALRHEWSMAGRQRAEKAHHSSETTKREERIESNGQAGSKPHNPSTREATAEAGEAVHKHPHAAPEVDAESASASLGIAESAQRDAGASIPDSPYQKRG